jgi:hypothetical protein
MVDFIKELVEKASEKQLRLLSIAAREIVKTQ